MPNDYYVYVYIDPRNFDEFYYGKGRDSRKKSHLKDSSDTAKTRRIKDIRKAGLEPIIRVIARDLTEHDALLVEKTLLWKLGKHLTNISSGHYGENFRPHDTMHLRLSGFDFQRGLYYYNVGENVLRNWDDYKRLGFISGGNGPLYRDALLSFNKGDVIAAYLKRHGFVGIGRITHAALPIRDVKIRGKSLLSQKLVAECMDNELHNDELCEYVARVKWIASVDREDARWIPKHGLFTTPAVRASLDAQPKTVEYLEREFDVNISDAFT